MPDYISDDEYDKIMARMTPEQHAEARRKWEAKMAKKEAISRGENIDDTAHKQDDAYEAGVKRLSRPQPNQGRRVGDRMHDKIWSITGSIKNKIRDIATPAPKRRLTKKERRSIHKAQRTRPIGSRMDHTFDDRAFKGFNQNSPFMNFGIVETEPKTSKNTETFGFNHSWGKVDDFYTGNMGGSNSFGFNHAWADLNPTKKKHK